MPVQHTDELEKIIEENGVSIGVIATPAGAAQQVSERLIAAGVTSILNFAPTVLSVPEGVDVRKVDLSIELQILAFHEQRKAGEEAAAAAAAGVPAPGTGTGAAPAAAVVPPAGRAAAVARKGGPEGDVPAVMPA